MNYAVGSNMAGYSPDPDSVWITDDFDAAKRSLIDNMMRAADSEQDPDRADELDNAAQYVNLWSPGDGLVYTQGDSCLLAWWIQETDQEVEDES